MRRSSLRLRLFLLSTAFSLALVGAVLVVAYLSVTGAMMRSAETQALRAATPAALYVADALRSASPSGGALSDAAVGATLDRARAAEAFFGAELALYDSAGTAVWWSDPRAVLPELASERAAAAARTDGRTASVVRGGLFSGMLGSADLGAAVVHVPVRLDAAHEGVLDVVYLPIREEAVVDEVQPEMLALAALAAVVSIAVMQFGVRWVLALVVGLTRAAEHVHAGDLDVQLPVHGDNEIGDLARSINELLMRLRRRADAQTRFVADASHELATPVAGIRGYVNILRVWGGEDPELRDEAIRAIDRESRRMARLTAELLSLIRGEREIELRAVRFDLNARCREVLADSATRHLGKQLEFIGPKEGQLPIVGDPDRIEEVVAILVDNAAKYTPSGGQVSVATRRRREQVVIEVSDSGPGIAEEDVPYIFDRFYRSDSSRSQETGGFGLGLAIAKRIVEAMGGAIEVSSVVDVGTTFVVRLPRAPA